MATALSLSSVAELGGSPKRSRRLASTLDVITERGEIQLTELAAQFATSLATMRRDLTVLADQGLIVRTHGGAKTNGLSAEVPVALRDSRFADAKRRIARASRSAAAPPPPVSPANSPPTPT